MSAQRFRKLPVEIEAIQLGNDYDEDLATLRWCGGVLPSIGNPNEDEVDPDVLFYIPTLEGPMAARVGDWIIKGVNGEFYPCKPDIFAKTYEVLS